MVDFIRNKVKFRYVFWVLIIIMLAFRKWQEVLILFFSIILHECCHIAVANKFGVKIEKIIFIPIGQCAVLKGFERLNWLRKLLIILVAPLTNLIISYCCAFIGGEIFNKIGFINFYIALFNLLPIFPMDGGQILHILIAKQIGVIGANRVVFKLSFICSIFLVFIGFIQMVLFSFNVSLFCIGIYLIRINKNERLRKSFEFYHEIMRKDIQKVKKIKRIKINEGEGIKKIMEKLSFDYNLIIEIYRNGKKIYEIQENDIFKRK